MSLDVYLNDERIGRLDPGAGNEYSFAYAPELLETLEAGTPLLSYSLPLRAEPYTHAETRPYVEGLLPEGEFREQIARELGCGAADGYALIAALGGDCPGAVTFAPAGSPPQPADPGSLAWLTDYELEEAVEEPEPLLDPEDPQRMRFALPGRRHKLALLYDERTDRWAWPEPGAPSTHILKPQGEQFDGLAVNEVACTLALREMGLPVAHTELRTIAGHPCLLSKRFDRWGEGAGAERLHQESFAQALGYAPEDLGGEGPGFAESRALLEAIDEADGVVALFTASYCNFLIGNRDEVHGKNSALFHTATGPLMAPFYDFSSKAPYEDLSIRYPLFEAVRRNSCLAALVPGAIECGFELQPAVELALETIVRLGKALDAVARKAQEEGWYEPLIDEILQRVIARLEDFRGEMEILKPPSLGGPSWAPGDLN